MLLFLYNDHIGSIDVDILFNQNDIGKAESYENIKRILTRNGYEKHCEKFASPDHTGPTDIVNFLGISDEEEADRIKQDAYQKVKYLTDGLS